MVGEISDLYVDESLRRPQEGKRLARLAQQHLNSLGGSFNRSAGAGEKYRRAESLAGNGLSSRSGTATA